MSEPEYRFVKGVGWVAAYEPIVYRIREDEVRVGDVIVRWSYHGCVRNPGKRYPITYVDKRRITGKDPNFSHHINGSVDWFEVER